MTETPARYDAGPAQINPACLRLFTDPAYAPPTPNDLRALMRRSSLTGSRVGDIVGVDSRTVRKWTGGEREMPYSAWRLLLLETTDPADVDCEFLRSNRGVGVVFTYGGRECLVSQEALDDRFAAATIGNEAAFFRGRKVIQAAVPRATATDREGRLIVREQDLA